MIEKEKLIALVQAVQAGEDDAATQLYITFQKDIYYFIYKTVNDRELAEDLTQDTFMDILQHIHKLQEPAAFVSWSRQIAYHRCTAYFRKQHDLLVDEEEDGYSVFDTVEEERAEFIPDAALDQDEFKKTIHEIINKLPEEQRSALLMRYFEELSVEEIAKIQGVPVGTVKSRLNYSRKAIKQSVESYEKKTGVKLRCIGILPILLWLFRGVRVAKGVSLTAKASSAVFTAASTAASAANVAMTAATVVSAASDASDAVENASVVASVAKEGAKKGIKALFATTASKVIAGVTATAVLGGGTAAVIVSQPDKPATVIYEEEEEEEPEETLPEWSMDWVGYGSCDSSRGHRYEIHMDSREENTISGTLTISYMYEGVIKTNFTGQARAAEETEEAPDTVVYDITLKKPFDMQYGSDVTETELVYHTADQAITLDDYPFEVKLQRQLTQPQPQVLVENGMYMGLGQDDFHAFENEHNARFEFTIDSMTADRINGSFRVYCVQNGEVLMHETGFSGRGYESSAGFYYEVKLETSRDGEVVFSYYNMQYLWMYYDEVADRIELCNMPYSDNFNFVYDVKMDRVEN